MAAVLLRTTLVTPSRPPRLSCSSLTEFSSGTSSSSLSIRVPLPYRLKPLRCQALGDNNSIDSTVYRGMYGPWTVDQTDVREVILYRSGLVTAALSFVIAASTAFLPEDNSLREFLKQDLNLLYTLGAGGLGLSLFLIHIYVTEIKRTLQAFWALGVVGSLATYLCLAQPAGQTLPDYIGDHPIGVLFVGPLFASLTGLVFKEDNLELYCFKQNCLCYGKLEAGVLTFVIPTVLLGHLSGLMDNGAKLSLLGVWMALFVIFAARKFTQPIKDDIGDKSVFIFNALPEKEKKVLLEKLEEQKFG